MARPTKRQKASKKGAKKATKAAPTKKAAPPRKKSAKASPAKTAVVRSAKTVVPPKAGRPLAPKKSLPRADRTVHITVNGRVHALELGRDLEPNMTLAYVLREKLGLVGLKVSCDEGACGACTVLMDGRAVLSCMTLAKEAHGHELLTIEGLAEDDPVVQAFAAQCEPGHGTALQCGYCTPGFVMASVALLREIPRPTLDDVKEGLSGNLCRCGCYAGIAKAVLHASDTIAVRGGA